MKIHLCTENPCLIEMKELSNLLNNGMRTFYTNEIFVSTNNKAYCNKYNRDTLKGRIYRKLNMVNWATKQYDFWKPIKDAYFNLAWKLYDKGYLDLELGEGDAMRANWIKYLRWTKKNSSQNA